MNWGDMRRYNHKIIPILAKALSELSVWGRKAKVLKLIKNGILIDINIHAWSVTHETSNIIIGDIEWRDITIKDGNTQSARIPKYSSNDKSREFLDIKYLTPIKTLLNKGVLKLWSSAELKEELFLQNSGRYRGYTENSYCLIPDTLLSPIDGYFTENRIWGPNIPYNFVEARKKRLKRKTDPLYRELADSVPEKHSQDVWHLYTAEKYELYCMLTMDYKFVNLVNSMRNKYPWVTINTKIMTPTDFGLKFGLLPVDPNIFSYNKLSYNSVRADLYHKPKFFNKKK